MKTYKYTPAYAKDKTRKVTVVKHPDAQWFANIKPIHEEGKRQMVRFALMSDGEIYFGDAFDIIHHDICQIVGPRKCGPLLVGVMDNDGEGWKVLNCQWFLGAPSEEAFEDGHHLIQKLEDWNNLPVDVYWGRADW